MSAEIIKALKAKIVDQAIALSVTGLAAGALPKVQRDTRAYFDVADDGTVKARADAPCDLRTLQTHLQRTEPFLFGKAASSSDGGKGGKKPTIPWNDPKALSANIEGVADGSVEVR